MTSSVADMSDLAGSTVTLRAFLHGLPGVDRVGADARAAGLATRSIKTTAKAWGIDLAIRMVDLTTLEGADTPGKVRALCAKARRPDPTDPSCPSVAAVCVYPSMVATAVDAVAGSAIHVASVATAFPSGQAPLAVKLADTRSATGRTVGVKPAGGIRTTKDALRYLVLVNETAGEDWLDPDRFRFGASSLLNDLLLQRDKLATGRYSGPDYVTLD